MFMHAGVHLCAFGTSDQLFPLTETTTTIQEKKLDNNIYRQHAGDVLWCWIGLYCDNAQINVKSLFKKRKMEKGKKDLHFFLRMRTIGHVNKMKSALSI